MWIRSQSKERLIDVDNVLYKQYVNHSNPNHKIETRTQYGLIELGAYSTKEKALEVLDMLETHLRNQYFDKGTLEDIDYRLYDDGVFQMPQDSEVE